MKIFVQKIFLAVVMIAQANCSVQRGFNCCSSSSELDGILKIYLNKWEESKQSMTFSIDKYQNSVSDLQSKRSCDSAGKDIKTVKDGATNIVKQVSRITDGCGQSLRQAILIAQYIERWAEDKRSEKACKALGESIEAITAAAKQIQRCQDQFSDAVNAAECASTEQINKIRSDKIGDEVFFNYAKLSLKITTLGNSFEECKAGVLGRLSSKLESLLNSATNC